MSWQGVVFACYAAFAVAFWLSLSQDMAEKRQMTRFALIANLMLSIVWPIVFLVACLTVVLDAAKEKKT